MNFRIFATIIISTVGLLAACTNTTPPNPPPAPSPQVTPTPFNPAIPIITSIPGITTPATIASDITTSTSGAIIAGIVNTVPAPVQIGRIYFNAGNVFINAKIKNFANAGEELKKIRSDMKDLIPLLKLTPSIPVKLIEELNSAVTKLEGDINTRKVLETMSNSNSITRYTLDISDYYKTELPPDIERLKYFGREIEISLDKNDYSLAINNYEQMKLVWVRAKTLFNETYSNDVLAFDITMSGLGKDLELQNSPSAKSDLKNIYDKVDALTADYMKQKKT